MIKRIIASVLALCMTPVILSSCVGKERRYESMPLVDPMSKQEVLSYYEEEMKIKNVVKRTSANTEDVIEFRELTGDESKVVDAKILETEMVLGKDKYETHIEVPLSMYHYIRSQIDDKRLDRSKIVYRGASREYYVADVEYTARAKGEAEFKEPAKYLGVHGAFRQDRLGNDYIDKTYINRVELAISEAVEEQYQMLGTGKMTVEELIIKAIERNKKEEELEGSSYQSSNGSDEHKDGDEETQDVTQSAENRETNTSSMAPSSDNLPNISTSSVPEFVDEDGNGIDDNDGRTLSEYQEQVNAQNSYGGYNTSATVDKEPVYKLDETNVSIYNQIIGSSLASSAYMPNLDLILVPSANEGTISGNGIYVNRDSFSTFGVDYSKIAYKYIIRYIFKKEIGTEVLKFSDAYVKGVESNAQDFEKSDIFPAFVENKIAVALERENRIVSNDNIAGSLSKTTIDNMRYSIATSYQNKYKKLHNISSEIAQYIERNGNLWLVKNTVAYQESVLNSENGPATYIENRWYVIEQKGSEFIIKDTIMLDKKCLKEPELAFSNSETRRYVYLALSGPLSERTKVEIKDAMSVWFDSINRRNGSDIQKMLNTDPDVMTTAKREKIFYTVKDMLEKMGSTAKTQHYGAITEWIGGAGDQAEIITEEVIVYEGTGYAQVMTNYYLVSNNNGWVIDELKNIYTTAENESVEAKIQEIQNYSK